ncbi:MAG: pyruvate dehydrogenase complex dihydrolipoamide acetyltransferase [Homoserinimonas sp.]|jgi:pyruvate dehydrogenase E2 component (dihydrolipoamide acetyltransferase)|nr:pyruvate dehydrogenase complex dihydrolipoamide acetyltransferase [Homoserinimonas sp.]
MASIIRMPEVLTGATEAALQTWLVSPGDEIVVGQPLAEVETEKATVEYAAEEAGTLAGLLIEVGVQVSVGTPIAVLAGPGESIEAALAAAKPVAGAPGVPAAPAPTVSERPVEIAAPETITVDGARVETIEPSGTQVTTERRFASPLVRRMARETGIALDSVRGTGPGGRIVRRDIERLEPRTVPVAQAATTPSPRIPAAPGGFTDIPHTGMRRAIARRLTESKSQIPHFYLSADVRVDELLQLRQRVNEVALTKVSVNDFVVKAVAAAFKDVPAANAIWMDDAIRRFDDVDIAIAVAIAGGLVTPVVRAANRLTLTDLALDIRELAGRGRDGKLKQAELEGGSFAVSNLGMFGTQQFSAIINPPHSGILAVGAASPRPVVGAEGQLTVAHVMTVTLSADHRVLDGALAAEWLAALVKRLESPVSLLI